MKLFYTVLLVLCFQNCLGLFVQPEQFGAKGDGKTDDTKAFQAMFDSYPESEKVVIIDLSPGAKYLIETVFYPKSSGRTTEIKGNYATFLIKEEGCGLLPKCVDQLRAQDKASDVDMHEMVVGSGKNKQDIMRWFDTFRISDAFFQGGKKQLQIVGTYHSSIERCQFRRAGRGLDLVFCMNYRVELCEFQFHKLEGLLVRSGMRDKKREKPGFFTNASGSNCQSNVGVIEQCRWYCAKDQEYGLRNYNSNSMVVSNCIFEGFAPEYSVHYDSYASTTNTYVKLENIHIEHGTQERTKAHLWLYQPVGIIDVSGIYVQYVAQTFMHAFAPTVKFSTPAYLTQHKFGTCGSKGSNWVFEDVNGMTANLADPQFWDQGLLPTSIVLREKGNIWTYGKTGMQFVHRNFEEGKSLDNRIIINSAQIRLDVQKGNYQMTNFSIWDVAKTIKMPNGKAYLPYRVKVDIDGKVEAQTLYIPVLDPRAFKALGY